MPNETSEPLRHNLLSIAEWLMDPTPEPIPSEEEQRPAPFTDLPGISEMLKNPSRYPGVQQDPGPYTSVRMSQHYFEELVGIDRSAYGLAWVNFDEDRGIVTLQVFTKPPEGE